MTIDEKLIDKIKKVLALSTSSNQHEAALALEKATAMMEQYNLSMRDIDRSQIGTTKVKSTQSVSKAKDWEQSLMFVVAKAFGCTLMFFPGVSANRDDYWARWGFIGEKTNAALAEYTATYLIRLLVKERHKFSLELSKLGYGRGKAMTAELDGFCKGWIKTVRAKVHAFANSDAMQAVIDEFVKELSTGKVKPHNRGNGGYGNSVGQEAGAGVHINRPMDENSTLRIGDR